MNAHLTIPLALTASALLSPPVFGQGPDEIQTEPAVTASNFQLWRGLNAGMAPQNALPFVQEIEGEKRAEIINARKPEKPKRIRVTHERDKIPIGSLGYELGLEFSKAKLEQVWFASQSACGEQGLAIQEQLSAGLSAKYPEVLMEPSTDRLDVLEAYSRSRTSGEKQTFTGIYANDNVAAVLAFAYSEESPPANPGYGSKLARALYNFALTEYRQRREECEGTGHRCVDIIIKYLPRSALEDQMEEAASDMDEERKELIDQL